MCTVTTFYIPIAADLLVMAASLWSFSDDTVLLSLLRGAQHDHGVALPAFVDWCKDNFLETSKTKEMMIYFRRNKKTFTESVIDGERIEIVSSYKYLGSMFDNQLKWDVNTDSRGSSRASILFESWIPFVSVQWFFVVLTSPSLKAF